MLAVTNRPERYSTATNRAKNTPACQPNTYKRSWRITDRIKRTTPIQQSCHTSDHERTMRKIIRALVSMLLSAAAHTHGGVEKTIDYSVQASASVLEKPARITLHWPQ